MAAPVRCSWLGIDRSLVASARAVKISWYIILLLLFLTARAKVFLPGQVWCRHGGCTVNVDGLIAATEIRLLNAVSWNDHHILRSRSPHTVQRSITLRPTFIILNYCAKTTGISFLGLFINTVIPCPSLRLGPNCKQLFPVQYLMSLFVLSRNI